MKYKHNIEPGSVLLAEPFMWDTNFKRSAILITDHNEAGSVGFIINKSIEMDVAELLNDFPEFNSQVGYGGPVQTDTIHYIHSVGHILKDSIPIANGIYWGGDFLQLKALIRNNIITTADIRFFVGYSGWSKRQLTSEIIRGDWVTAKFDKNYLFNNSNKHLWKDIMAHKGNTFTVIGQMPDSANWN